MRHRSVSSSSSSSSKPAAVSLLLLLVTCFFFHCATAARPSPTFTPAHQENDGAKAAADEIVVLHQDGAGGNGDEDSESELMGAEADEEACSESEGNDDECMQRRLLRDAHLDYIYTQHKGKP
ncbi:hypothetical protein GUJ93_ZPchr0009g1603 [Zizania palustris]|uniref:Phytosulfokine n=1 Tax=Zizania palustris TaxID=103762 RepID=A0A8J5UZ00_ZIZPA|nr:hypothetical protein GUJ93_ZPchr0009g1603 [Zizania palustris]